MTYTIAVCTVKSSWWWTEQLPETCRASFQNKFEKFSASSWFYYRDSSRCTVTWTQNSVSVISYSECTPFPHTFILCTFTNTDTNNPLSRDSSVGNSKYVTGYTTEELRFDSRLCGKKFSFFFAETSRPVLRPYSACTERSFHGGGEATRKRSCVISIYCRG